MAIPVEEVKPTEKKIGASSQIAGDYERSSLFTFFSLFCCWPSRNVRSIEVKKELSVNDELPEAGFEHFRM